MYINDAVKDDGYLIQTKFALAFLPCSVSAQRIHAIEQTDLAW